MRASPAPEGELKLVGAIETNFSSASAVDNDGQRHAGASINVTCGTKDDILKWNDARAKHLEEYQNHFSLPNGTCGVPILCAGRVVTLDLFDRPETFAVQWDRLSRAHFFDAIRWRVGSSSRDAEPVERFLDRLASFARSKTAIGLGDELEINSMNRVGAAMVHDSRLGHLAAFADAS